jgi:hypothetical protein
MSGKPKQQVFVYTFDGKYLERFSSESEFRQTYYPTDIGKRPIFCWKELEFIYHINFSREIIAFKERPGRDKIKLILAIHNSEYCKDSDYNNIPVQVFNLKGELIAEFRSQRLLSKFMPSRQSSINNALTQSRHTGKYKVANPEGGLFFKYKDGK